MDPQWFADRTEIMELLHREVRLQQVVKLVGPDALPDTQRFVLEVCSLFKNAFLQQNAYDKIDTYSTVQKQARMLHIIITYWKRGSEAILTARSSRGTITKDTFSLLGFTAALEEAEARCSG